MDYGIGTPGLISIKYWTIQMSQGPESCNQVSVIFFSKKKKRKKGKEVSVILVFHVKGYRNSIAHKFVKYVVHITCLLIWIENVLLHLNASILADVG